jgi:AcrR family transcriptional regulator
VTGVEASRPLRADARQNREKLLSAALAAFARSGADASLDAIARDAGVGIGTLYRHFPTREALVLAAYRHEVDHLCDAATELLDTMPPDRALREWMDRIARYVIAKQGLAEALQAATAADTTPLPAVYGQVLAALEALLDAGARAGTIRSDVSADDVMRAMSGLMQLNPRGDWQDQARRLLDLLMDGLRAGARPAA